MDTLSTPLPIENVGENITDKTVCVKVRLGRLGNSRKVPTSQVEVDTDKSMIRVSKHLLDSKSLKSIANFDGEIRRYLYNICLPLDVGIHLCPLALLEAVESQLREFSDGRKALIQTFLEQYPALCQNAAGRLASLYNPTDYPDLEYVRQQFSFDWRYLSFAVPDQLKAISATIWAEEREKAASMMKEAGSEIQQVLRAGMLDLVSHMADRLKPGEDGKPRKFKESTVSNLLDFLGTFDFRNVTDDADLKQLVDQAREMLSGVKADDLRSNEALRDGIAAGMAKLSADLDGLVVRKHARKFRTEENESEEVGF